MRRATSSRPRPADARRRSVLFGSTVVVTVMAVLVGPLQLPAVAAPVAASASRPSHTSAADGTAGKSTAGPAADVVVNGWGAADGYHLEVGRGGSGYVWREVALLRPAGLDESSWTGYQCVSGDGDYAGVAIEPSAAVNVEATRDRGAFAYSVNLSTGRVQPIASGVGLKYFSPGCGTSDTAVFTLNLGSNDTQTELVTANLATGKVGGTVKLAGQVTSTVPTAHGLVGVAGTSLVAIDSPKHAGAAGRTQVIARAAGDPYDLRPAADGGVSFLAAAPGSTTATIGHEHDGTLSRVGSGPLTRMQLFQGRAGHAVLSGASATTESGVSAASIRVVNDQRLVHGAVAASLDGGALLGDPSGKATAPLLLATGHDRLVTDKQAPAKATAVLNAATFVPPGAATTTTAAATPGRLHPHHDAAPAAKPLRTGNGTPAQGATKPTKTSTPGARRGSTGPSTGTGAPTHPRSGSASSSPPSLGSHGPSSASDTRLTAGSGARSLVRPQIAPPTDPNQDPTCAVAPLDEQHQVLQPSSAQVNWASQMDEQGLLTGSTYARPADFDNMGYPAYSPSDDFPPITLDHPSGSSQTTVPASVYEAIMAQESNYDQASWHAPEGTAGDPLIADYYGAHYDIKSIDYANADCGYGIGQVTDGMHVGDTSLSARGQVKVAVDYQENIAAGLQILETTWNQLYSDGIIANNGDPADLENWFFAAWAYNSGIQPTGAYDQGCTPGPSCTGPDGTWGLGWANNPENPDYPPTRDPYLKDTYADAAHPANWSYEERVMGWMGSPIIKDNTQAYDTPSYHGGNSWLQIPPFDAFCSVAGDHCDPAATNTSNPAAGHCQLDDYECWWHSAATWIPNCASTCATSAYQYSGGTEPIDTNHNPYACNVDRSSVPSSALIVDDQTSPYYNLMGCSGTNWSSDGTFNYSFGQNSAGDPIGAIDTHQLGTGLGGHDLFTHTEDGTNPSLINTGTWTPTLPKLQYYKIKLHFPALGANATDVIYTINPGGGASPFKIRVNQAWNADTWATIGTFAMQNGGNVVLTNQSSVTGSGNESLVDFDVAFDAIAFVPEGGSPGTPIGGPPTVQDEPTGSNPAWVQCGCAQRTAGDPVNTATGYYGDSFTDLSTPGRRPALDFTRTYAEATADPAGPNGSSAVNGPFGYGWTDSYNLSATTATGSGNVTVTQEDGSQVAFTDTSGTYAPVEPRDDATLVKSGTSYIYTRRGREIFTFTASNGRLIAEQGLAGKNASTAYKTTLAYNGSGQLSTITDPAGRTYTLTWTSGHITKLADSAGRIVTYTYDSSNDLIGAYGVASTRTPTLLSNDLTSYGYSTSTHLMTSIRTPNNQGGPAGAVTAMTYDSSERVLTQADPNGHTTTFAYGPSSSPSLTAGQTLVTDPAGHKTLDSYTGGLLTSETAGYGTSAAATTSFTYDPISLGISAEVDPNGDTTTYAYDDHGNRISASDPGGYVTDYAYDAAGDRIETIDPTGLATVNGYDQAGHVKTSSGTNNGTFTYGDLTSTTVTQTTNIVDISSGNYGTAPTRTINYYYDDAAHPGDQSRVIDALGKTTTRTYDTAGDLASTTDPDGNKSLQGWDTTRGWLTHTVTPDGTAAGTTVSCTPPATGCITYTHDAYGDVTSTTDPAGHTSSATFDANGNKTSVTDADGNKTSYTYDPADQLTVTTRPDATTVKASYNGDGTVHSSTDANANTTSYGYDGQGRQITVTNPDNRTTTTAYDPNGNITTVTDPAGQTTTTSYDADNRPTSISYSDATPNVTAISYDPDGRRTAMTDGTGTSTWAYDAFGELTAATTGAGASVGYSYDDDGQLSGLTYPDGTTATNGYDNAGRLTSVTDAASNTTSFGYTPDGQLGTTGYPNATTVADTYNSADQQTATTLKNGSSTLGGLAYGRDNAGQLTSQTPSVSLPGAATSYTYTALQQVKTAATTGSGTSNYSYDPGDNITTNAGVTAKNDAADQLCWTTTATVTGTPACTAPPTGATSYTYNTNGQRTATTPATGTASSYSYNQTGELTTATTGTGSGTYTYDATGVRASKTVNGTTTQFTYAALNGANQLLTDGSTDYLYGPGNQPIEQTNTTATSYYVPDQLGNTIALTNTTGAITATYTYNTYGKTTAHTGPTTTPLQYGGGYTDPETGLIYLQNRYYDPTTAQFLTIDPALATTGQPYTYTGDNPLNGTDPTGLCWTGFGAVCHAAHAVSHFVSKHKKGLEIAGGIALGVVAAGTGVGAFVEGASAAGILLGATSVTASIAATKLDYGPCVHDHNAAACLGLGLGAAGGLASAASLAGAIGVYGGVIAEGELADGALSALGVFGSTVGLAGTVLDGTSSFAPNADGTESEDSPRVRGSWNGASIAC